MTTGDRAQKGKELKLPGIRHLVAVGSGFTPEVVDIVDATGHAAGTKPFYERTSDEGATERERRALE